MWISFRDKERFRRRLHGDVRYIVQYNFEVHIVKVSVVDQDPVGSETYRRIRKSHSRYGQLRIRNEIEVKLRYSDEVIKFDNFSTAMLSLEI